MDFETSKNYVKANADWLNKILWLGSLIVLIIIMMKLIGGDSIPFIGINIPIEYSYVAVVLFTIAHFYTMLMFKISLRNIWKDFEYNEYSKVFDEITTTGGIFMRGLKPRLLNNTGGSAIMDSKDVSSAVSHIVAILLFISLIPFKLEFNYLHVVAFFIVYLNWIIGSQWAIALSELTIEKDKSILLANRKR